MKQPSLIGTVYLIHFERRYKHAGHYIGFATDLGARLEAHAKGRGSRLMEVVVGAGIGFVVAQTWEQATRYFERTLKNRGGAARSCPLCKQKIREAK